MNRYAHLHDNLWAVIRHVPSVIFVFLAAGIVVYLLEVIAKRERLSFIRWFKFCFPARHWISRSTKVDVVIYLCTKATQPLISLACKLGLAFSVSTVVAGLKAHFDLKATWHESVWADGLCLFLVFVLADFGEFLSHYLQHRIPMLWEFHKVHHSATFLSPFTTTRSHPIGNFIDGALIAMMMVPAVLVAELGFNLSLMRIVELSGTVELIFTLTFLRHLQHSHFRISFGFLDRIMISPLMHHVHHSVKPEHWNKNFGSRLSVWDWWFGSAVILPKEEQLRFGLGTEEDERGDYQSVVTCYVRPVTGFHRLLKAAAARASTFDFHASSKPVVMDALGAHYEDEDVP